MQSPNDRLVVMKRRTFLRGAVGSAALATLLNPVSLGAESSRVSKPTTAKKPHFPARAKSVIYIHLVGAPSQLDLFDPKPVLIENNGKPCPKSI